MSLLTTILRAASRQISDSGVRYAPVDLSESDYTTPFPFRGIILEEAGPVEVTGLDGVSVVLPLQPGINPAGGIGIKAAGTTATTLVVVF